MERLRVLDFEPQIKITRVFWKNNKIYRTWNTKISPY